jgi:hypothetical protein
MSADLPPKLLLAAGGCAIKDSVARSKSGSGN